MELAQMEMPEQPVVETRGLVAAYGDERVLDGVDFRAQRGLITVILGGSGCGKSTLLRHALGLQRPLAGSVRLFGQELKELSDEALREIRMRIGVLFQGGALFSSMTVGENVAMPIRENAEVPEQVISQLVRMKLAQVGLEDAMTKHPEELSGGMRKRAALARAIAVDPEILFCDEPSAGLDPPGGRALARLLSSLPAAMLVATHDLDFARRLCARFLVLDAGHIAYDGAETMAAQLFEGSSNSPCGEDSDAL